MFDFATFPVLLTERLRLRQITRDDAEPMMALFSAPEVLQFLNSAPTDTPEKALGLIDWLAGNYARQEGIDWAITLRDDSAPAQPLIGMCGAYSWDKNNRRVDIGYHLQPAYWGRGYATEAARAIVGWCFEHLDVHRIQADCTEGHAASERVMLKCGFRLEGTWRESCWEHGRFVNIRQFGLLRGEFSG